jgi:hypothetical protein
MPKRSLGKVRQHDGLRVPRALKEVLARIGTPGYGARVSAFRLPLIRDGEHTGDERGDGACKAAAIADAFQGAAENLFLKAHAAAVLNLGLWEGRRLTPLWRAGMAEVRSGRVVGASVASGDIRAWVSHLLAPFRRRSCGVSRAALPLPG